MMGGDAAMVVALADSLFFDIDLDAARGRVMLFLALSFAPFLFVAPLIGPLIDRVAGGRRLVIQIVAVARAVLLVLMAMYMDSLVLFPLVFASLVLQKTYVVSKSALVPSTVRSAKDLVEANSKLGLISGLTGAVAILPAAALLKIGGAPSTMVYGAMIFAAAFFAATRLPPEVVASTGPDAEEELQLHSRRLVRAAVVMTVLRAAVGYTLFHLAFLFRSDSEGGAVWFAAAVGLSALATMVGNAIAPRLRNRMKEETMLIGALGGAALFGVVTALFGGPLAGTVLAAVLNLAASVSRLSFESIVQHDAPGANQGRAFATFETRFQLSWAVAAFVAVAVPLPGAVGYLVVGVVATGTLVQLLARPLARRGPTRRNPRSVSRRPRAPATDPAPRSRSEWEPPKRR
jgi:hypothetical protein